MPIALSAGQNISELLDERLSPLRIGPAQQLLGFLPRQLAAVQGRPDRLAAAHQPEALAHPADEAVQRPARRRIGPFERWGGRRALGGADRLAAFGCAGWAKRGRRPPVRRNASASGPWALEACTQSITVWARRPVRPATWVAQRCWVPQRCWVMSNRARARSRVRAWGALTARWRKSSGV